MSTKMRSYGCDKVSILECLLLKLRLEIALGNPA